MILQMNIMKDMNSKILVETNSSTPVAFSDEYCDER